MLIQIDDDNHSAAQNKLLISHATLTWLILCVIKILSKVFWYSLTTNTIQKLTVLLKLVKLKQPLPQTKYEWTTTSSVELKYFKIPLHWPGPLFIIP